MDHKNANNITDTDLYNGFVWVQEDGQAVSMYYGKKILWNVVTGVEEVDKWHVYTKVSYAMLAATHTEEELADMDITPVKISAQPDGESKPFLINAVHSDVKHAIIAKLRTHYERTRSYASKNDNN